MKISIIVPYRERDQYLRVLVNQFSSQQKFPQSDYEIIVVRLGGTQPTNIYNKPNINIREIYVDYNGIFSRGYCCNVGAKQAKNEVIWFVDVDCIPHPFMLKIIQENFSVNNPYFAINVPVIFLNRIKTLEVFGKPTYTWDDYNTIKTSPRFWLKRKVSGTSQVCMHKENFISLGGVDEEFVGHGYEDMLLHDQIASHLKTYWGRFPHNIEIVWSEKRDLVLTHLYHGERNRTSTYMSNYQKNLKYYRQRIGDNVMKNNVDLIWGSVDHPPGSNRLK